MRGSWRPYTYGAARVTAKDWRLGWNSPEDQIWGGNVAMTVSRGLRRLGWSVPRMLNWNVVLEGEGQWTEMLHRSQQTPEKGGFAAFLIASSRVWEIGFSGH